MDYMILNLHHSEMSDVKYKINQFPDGQKSITLLEPELLYKKVHVIVAGSVCSFCEWELILSAISALKAHTNEYSVYTPYVLGARSDRKFEAGGDFYFADLSQKILRDLNCAVIVHDLHCDSEFGNVHPLNKVNLHFEDSAFIFPDRSAEERFDRSIYSLNSSKNPIDRIRLIKTRRNEEVLQQFLDDEDLENFVKNDNFVIFDDLFDGGASFVNLCERIRNEYEKSGKITIFVTHFIGSNLENLEKLKELGVKIITTNSYNCSEEAKSYVTQIDVFKKDYIFKACNIIIDVL